MNETYDVIILGTGLKECILSGLLSVAGKKVLHMDRNSYYGGESASLNLEQLYSQYGDVKEQKAKPAPIFGKPRDYNVDLCPKFIMACGSLVKILLHTGVTRYLDFKKVGGSYVYHANGEIYKVPAAPQEALTSSLVSLFQKNKFRKFLVYVNNYNEEEKSTHNNLNLNNITCNQLFSSFNLNADTVDFIGHALALHINDNYLNQPAKDTVLKIKLYAHSLSRYGDSPYIYPIWGLGGLPEGFSRLSAVYGGVYMLNKPIDEILYDNNGKVTGVRCEDETASCEILIGDPTYFMGTDKIRGPVSQVARCICILDHPLPKTKDADSCQIILSQKQLNRHSDIYISCVSFAHNVAANGKYVVCVSCQVETNDPYRELNPALRLIGPVMKSFFFVTDSYEAANQNVQDNVFITSSYDATTHFETTTKEVIELYERIVGAPLDLTISAEPEQLEHDF